MSNFRLLAAMVLVLSLSVVAFGGKLGAIRDAANGRSTSKRPTPPKPSTGVQEASSPPADARKAPARSTSTAGKLASIVSQVRNEPKNLAAPPRSPEFESTIERPPYRHTRPRRPSRSPRGLGHLYISSTPAAATTIIEEHHYYTPTPVIVDVPCVSELAHQQVATCPPPRMEPTAVVVDTVLEPAAAYEAVTEPVFDSFEPLPPWHVRFGLDYASDVDDVSRMGFDLLANATGGLGVDTGLRLFREQGDDFRDHLWIGDFNIVYELLPTSWIRPRVGAGLNWLADGFGVEAGLNLTCGVDVLVGPVTLTGEADFGTLGDIDLLHRRVTAGIRQGGNFEWFAGYDHLDIGGVEIRGVVGGLRFRF